VAIGCPEKWAQAFVEAVIQADHAGAEVIVSAGIPLQIRQTVLEQIREKLQQEAPDAKPLCVVLDDGQVGLRPDATGRLVRGAAANIENPASYSKTNRRPEHLERGPAETAFLIRSAGVWEARRTGRVQVFSAGAGANAAAGKLLAESLEQGRALEGGQRILALHCGEVFCVMRQPAGHTVRGTFEAQDAERILTSLHSVDLVANICHKFFQPAGEWQSDHKGRARYISTLGGGMVVAAWNANRNQKVKADRQYGFAFRAGVEVQSHIAHRSENAVVACYF